MVVWRSTTSVYQAKVESESVPGNELSVVPPPLISDGAPA